MNATIVDGIVDRKTLRYTHASALAEGDCIVVNGQVLIALYASAANVENAFARDCRAVFPKKANLQIPVGIVCYFDTANDEVTAVAENNKKIGVCIEHSAASATTVLVHLGENK